MSERTSFILVGLIANIFALATTLLFTQSNICTIACTCEYISRDGISCDHREAMCQENNCTLKGCINQNNLQCYLQGDCYSGWCAVGWILVAMLYLIGICALVIVCWQSYKKVNYENGNQAHHSNYIQLRDDVKRSEERPEKSNKIDLVI